jgi:hypothetical protein
MLDFLASVCSTDGQANEDLQLWILQMLTGMDVRSTPPPLQLPSLNRSIPQFSNRNESINPSALIAPTL